MRWKPAIVLLCAIACGDKVPAETADTETDPPAGDCGVLASAVVSERADTPLAMTFTATTSVATTVAVSWTNEDHTHTVSVDFSEATDHRHTLLGFRPGQGYTVTMSFSGASCASEATVEINTEALPPYFPKIELVVEASATVAPGETLVAMRTPANVFPGPAEITAVIDFEGNIVWWKDVLGFNQDALERESGLLLTLNGTGEEAQGFEWKWSGEMTRSWSVDPNIAPPGIVVDAASGRRFHHDFAIVAGASEFVALMRYDLPVQNWPADYEDESVKADAVIADDVFVHFSEAGAILSETLLSDLLPVTRIGYDSLETVDDGWKDWAHANAIEMDLDGHIIASLRHLDCVIKFDPVTKKLDWILGNHDNWPAEYLPYLLEPSGPDFRWAYHQHGSGRNRLDPAVVSVTMFDNGNWQASPFTGDPIDTSPRSRLVQFTIDEDAMTVTQDWSYEETEVGPLYSLAVGEHDVLDNGNSLGTFGFLTGDKDGTNVEKGWGADSARIIELDPVSGREQWHIHLYSEGADNPDGWTAYRSHRIAAVTGRKVE